MRPERNLVVAVAAAGHDQGQVVEDTLAETLVEGQAMGGGEIDPRLPFLGTVIAERLRRNPVLHERSPCCCCISSASTDASERLFAGIVTCFETAVIARPVHERLSLLPLS